MTRSRRRPRPSTRATRSIGFSPSFQAGRLGPPPLGRLCADHSDRRRARTDPLPHAHRRRLLQHASADHAARSLGGLRGQRRHRFRVPDGAGGPVPDQPLPTGARVGRRLPADSGEGPDGRRYWICPPPSAISLRGAPRARPGDRTDRQRQVDDARGDPRSHQEASRPPRDHDRGPDRVRPHQRQVVFTQREVGADVPTSPTASRLRSARTPTACSSARCATSRRCAWP